MEHVDMSNLEQEEQDKQLEWLYHNALIWPQMPRTVDIKSGKNVWHRSTINNNKKSKIDLKKEIESSVKGMIKKHKNTRK